MNYEPLNKIFYKNPELFQQIYIERFNSPTTKHLNFSIKQFNHNKEFQAFLCYTEEMMLLFEKIYKKYEKFLIMLKQVPPIVLQQFTLWCLIGEIMSTNDIEGIQSESCRKFYRAFQVPQDFQVSSKSIMRYSFTRFLNFKPAKT